MRKLLLLITLTMLLVCGCNKQKPFIWFSSNPITAEFSHDKAEINFNVEQKIYFVLYNPKSFKSDVVKMQILKLNDKGPFYNVTIVQTRELEIDPEVHFILNSFVLHSEGRYFLRVFSIADLQKPIAEADFVVSQ